MNILIKLMSIVSLVIAPYIAISATDSSKLEVKQEIRIQKTVDSLGNQTIDTLVNKTDTVIKH